MKKYFAMFVLFVIALFTFGQTTDSTAVVTYDFGDSFMEFLKTNLWTLILVIMYFLSEWIGESDKIPEGSIWRKVVNFLFSLAKKKATESPKMKAVRMKHEAQLKAVAPESEKKEAIKEPKKKSGKATKMLILGVLLSSMALTASAQPAFKSLFQPVTVETIKTKQIAKQLRAGSDTISVNDNGALIMRFGATVLGAKTNFSVADGKFVTEPFSRSGFGITFSHFINNEGEVFNNYGFGGYVLFPITEDITQQFMSLMVDVSALQLFNSFTFNLGVGYDINKYKTFKENWFIAPGVKITF